ncbi:fibroblast growth factor receptor-like 1 isoform X2 [Montipora foliosa]|uniref:fibroblast growth factor receptor-like 1 isoform X2 n=1 Tax=Montipora foliosa TaxID=591990 RepID=UPI0035F1A592
MAPSLSCQTVYVFSFSVILHGVLVSSNQQYPPQFEKRPKLQYNAEAGNDIRLRCLVKGNPPPTVAWIKDQKLVQLSSRIRLNSRGNSTLKIKKTQPDDAGNYTCTATNVLGKINATLELHVHKGTSSPPPTTQVPTPRKSRWTVILLIN